jgi:[acyl-carrier-protein] S-malonyltransferase
MKLAMVFPGQGSQSLGMMRDYGIDPVVRDTFDEASTALGEDLWQLVESGPAPELDRTVNTQPVMLAADTAVWRLWQQAGGATPAIVAGHSLGEYAALVAAGVLAFPDAVRIVRARAAAMQDAVPEGQGGIAAILGLGDDQVRASCIEAEEDGEVVEPANLNAPGQVVISGSRPAVERAIAAAKARGAKRAVLLPMSVPAHCALMRPAADVLRTALDGVAVSAPRMPVINNVDVATPSDAAAITDALVRQLYRPVRWIEVVQHLARQGVTHIVECGPGKVLQSLVKRISPETSNLTLSSAAAIADGVAHVR